MRMKKNILIDSLDRIARKLRVSVTDRCNMRCICTICPKTKSNELTSMLRSGKSEYYIKKQIIEDLKKKPEGIIQIIKTNSLKPSLNLMHTIGG